MRALADLRREGPVSSLAMRDSPSDEGLAPHKSPNEARNALAAPRKGSLNVRRWQECEECGTLIARPCDLRKHKKRHTRPYGCTYPQCHKTFGAKSDWKRHETSQHFQLESFRCRERKPSTDAVCGALFYRPKQFECHLIEEHKITDRRQIEGGLEECKIGSNNQFQFWCGFCQRLIKLRKERNEAWDERFDHIDGHFSKEGKKIEEWSCVETQKTKGEEGEQLREIKTKRKQIGRASCRERVF